MTTPAHGYWSAAVILVTLIVSFSSCTAYIGGVERQTRCEVKP